MGVAPRHVIFGTGAIGLATMDALRRHGETASTPCWFGSARRCAGVNVAAVRSGSRRLVTAGRMGHGRRFRRRSPGLGPTRAPV